MINYGELITEYGKIKYIKNESDIHIAEYSGRDLCVEIPDYIDNLPVSIIKKKAFLSQALVKEIKIPASVYKIEDYAFARCRKLKTVFMPYSNITLGQDVFKDCDRLSYIKNCEDINDTYDDVSFLLAKTLNELDAFFLFDLENAGTDEWMRHLDATIAMRLDKDDMENFSQMILCGEEEVICGEDGKIEDSDPAHYRSNRIKEKIRISFMRLIHDYKLDDMLRNKMNDYLLSHIKGSESDETWQVVLNEHGDDKDYYDYLLKTGGINSENINEILSDMGDRHTEIKAYLMKYYDENMKSSDLFDDFSL